MSGVLNTMLAVGGAPGVINDSLPDGIANGACGFTLNSDGTYAISTSQTGNWVTPASTTVAAYYQVKVDATSGAFSTGTTGAWLDMSGNHSWSLNPPASAGSEFVTFTVTFREKATGIVRSTQTGLTLEAVTV